MIEVNAVWSRAKPTESGRYVVAKWKDRWVEPTLTVVWVSVPGDVLVKTQSRALEWGSYVASISKGGVSWAILGPIDPDMGLFEKGEANG